MKLDEAIEQFKYDAECNRADLDLSFAEDNDKVAEWLEELKQYRAIGTPEECRAAVEKHEAKIADISGDGYADGHMVYDTYECPSCGEQYELDYDDYEYCPKCGQHLLIELDGDEE